MAFCSNCGAQVDDGVQFCPSCGAPMNGNAQPYQQAQAFDHTAEFDAEDVHEHKLLAMLLYLVGGIAIIYALLVYKESPYLKFHVKQSLKFLVSETLLILVCSILSFLIIPIFLMLIGILVLAVCQLICLVWVIQNKSVEPPIVRSLNFLN